MDDRTLPRLLEVGRSLAVELDLDPLLERVLEVARDVTDARFAAVGVLDATRSTTERFLTSGADGDVHRDLGRLAADQPPAPSFLRVPIMIGDVAWGNLYLCDKAGADFTPGDEDAMIVLADWTAIAIAKAQLHELERNRLGELRRATQALETTIEVTTSTDEEIPLDRVLDLIATRGRALIDARSLLLALVEEGEFRVAAGAGAHGVAAVGRRQPVAGTVAAGMLRSMAAERVGGTTYRATLGTLDPSDTQAALIVPLVFRGRALGVLVAFDRLERGPSFTAEDQRLLQSFATTAAIAVATAQQVESQVLQRILRASEEERRRWARELHDDTLQDLASMRLSLAGALRRDSPDETRAVVVDVMERASTAVENLRGLISELRPTVLDEVGVSAALKALGQRVASTSGVDVEMCVELDDEATRYRTEIEDTIYRVVQEALTNVVKHADATTVTVTVEARDDRLHLSVRDDGCGFAEGAPQRSDGFGLIGMRERVALVRGQLEIHSQPGAGTTVLASLPSLAPSAPPGPPAPPAPPAGVPPSAAAGRVPPAADVPA